MGAGRHLWRCRGTFGCSMDTVLYCCQGIPAEGTCRDRPSAPFRCLEAPYQCELMRMCLLDMEARLRTASRSRRAEGQGYMCRDRPSAPFRCLEAQYRRELVRVYLSNVETLARKFVEEKREALLSLRGDPGGFMAFWAGLDAKRRRQMATASGEVILKVAATCIGFAAYTQGYYLAMQEGGMSHRKDFRLF